MVEGAGDCGCLERIRVEGMYPLKRSRALCIGSIRGTVDGGNLSPTGPEVL